MGFVLHPQLANDTFEVGHLSLSRVLLMNDANYPWIILVPERENITELFQLSALEQQILMQEISVFSRMMHERFNADKINVGALGNIAPQLHIHLIVRYRHDAAWPKPVWGTAARKEYTSAEIDVRLEQFRALGVGAMREICGVS